MPRQFDGEPPVGKVYKVDSQHRVELKADDELRTYLPWLTNDAGPVDRVALRGPYGGITIEDPATVRAALDALQAGSLTAGDAGTKQGRYARALALRWPISFEKGRWRFTLPEEARNLGLVPSKGERAVLFVSGAIFEVWRLDRWLDHPHRVAADDVLTVEAILRDLT
jgi:hypothetical protein